MRNSTHRDAAVYYQEIARQAVRYGNPNLAREAYHRCLIEYKRAMATFPSLRISLKGIQSEFQQFARTDKQYQILLPAIKRYLSTHVPATTDDLYAFFNQVNRSDIEFVLAFAEEAGVIKRKTSRKGSLLSLAKSRSDRRRSFLGLNRSPRRKESLVLELEQRTQEHHIYDTLQLWIALGKEVKLVSPLPDECSLKSIQNIRLNPLGSHRSPFSGLLSVLRRLTHLFRRDRRNVEADSDIALRKVHLN